MNNSINEKLSRREREKAAHRQEILDAAIKVFAKKGFYEATLDEVAQEAEFSKGAIYLYFSNKEDLLSTIVSDSLEEWTEFYKSTITGKESFREELTAMFNSVAERIFSHPELFTLLSVQHASLFNALSREKRNEACKIHNKIWESFNERVKIAIENEELRDLPPKAIEGMVHGSLDAMVHNRWDFITLNELKNGIVIFMDILFNGIAKRKEI